MDLRIGHRRNENVRKMVLRFDEIELRFMRVVVVGHVLVGNADLGSDFLVHHLVERQGTANIALEIVGGDVLFLQPGGELFRGVGRFNLVQFAVDFFVGGQQAQLLGPVHQNLVVNQFAQNAEAKTGGLFSDRLLFGARSIV